MTILEVTAAPFGPGREGGGERHPTWFAAELARHEPVLFAYADPGGTKGLEAGHRPIPSRYFDLPPFLTATNPIPRLQGASTIRSVLRENAGDIDFVHVHNLRTASATLWILLAELRKHGDGFRVILTDHGARFFPWPTLTARMVDYYAPVSRFSEAILQALAPHPSRIIPAAVSTAFTAAPPPPDWSERSIDLLFVGRVVPWKRPERLLELAARTSERLGRSIRVVVAGAVGDRWFWDSLRERARRLAPRVAAEFWANPPDQDLIGLYRRAKIFVFASDPVDSLGRRHAAPELSSATILEAASQGTPTLARRLPASEENIRDGVTGAIVDALESGPALDRTVELLESPVTWSHYASAARAYVLAERTYPRIVEQFRGYLDDIRRGAV